jgi:hypothetical protein
MKRMGTAGAAFGLLALAGAAAGEQKGEAERPARLVTPLKVQLVVTKRLGDKKLSSLSYSFPCNAAGAKLSLNLGVEVPVPVRKADRVEFQYRSVGSNIECEAAALADGRFDLRVAFEQSSLYNAGAKGAAPDESLESRVDNPMLFRTAKSYFNAVLRDGQTTEAVSGADPLTGEVVAIDVTLAVAK